MKQGFWLLVVIVLLSALLISACAPAAPAPSVQPAAPKPAAAKPAEAKPAAKPAQEIVLKAVAFLPKNLLFTTYTVKFVEKVNEQAKGQLRIDYLGGPEVIPALEQVEALRKGTMVQMTFSPSAYYAPLAPEVDMLQLSELTPMDERKPGGLHDFMVERHQKIGIAYLGRWSHGMPFYLFTNKKVDKPQQLAGQKMRTTALYDPLMKALRIVPITMPIGDIYTSMERGVVDGFGLATGITDAGLDKVTKYIIEPSFYEQNTTILVSLDVWNKIPKNLQDLMKKIAIEMDPEMMAFYSNVVKKEREDMLKGGMQVIQFSPEDAKWYRDLAYKVQWDEIAAKVKDPGLVAKMQELTKKK